MKETHMVEEARTAFPPKARPMARITRAMEATTIFLGVILELQTERRAEIQLVSTAQGLTTGDLIE